MIGEAEARSALGWWLEAGVDVAIQEEPRNWLLPPRPRTAIPAEILPEPNVAPPSHETLAGLQDWLASSTKLPLASATARRIMPHGPENAAIMISPAAVTIRPVFASPSETARGLDSPESQASRIRLTRNTS